ncbi:hypothetical protein SEA_AMORE2_92 [Gordonia phage Amore2]|nr:hypothetical protein SEA_AMORE2_92 [Gordonia phage Amore2]
MAPRDLTRCGECGEFVHWMFDYVEELDMHLCDVCMDARNEAESA